MRKEMTGSRVSGKEDMNKKRKKSFEQEAIRDVSEHFLASKQMIDLINTMHTKNKLKMLDLYNSYFKPKKGESKR